MPHKFRQPTKSQKKLDQIKHNRLIHQDRPDNIEVAKHKIRTATKKAVKSADQDTPIDYNKLTKRIERIEIAGNLKDTSKPRARRYKETIQVNAVIQQAKIFYADSPYQSEAINGWSDFLNAAFYHVQSTGWYKSNGHPKPSPVSEKIRESLGFDRPGSSMINRDTVKQASNIVKIIKK
jgi:hypothetical protein